MIAIITIYGVVKIQNVMMNSELYYNDPRHPRCNSSLFPILLNALLLRFCALNWMDADCLVKHMYTSEQAKVVEDKPGH
jgi:hypothetical protein